MVLTFCNILISSLLVLSAFRHTSVFPPEPHPLAFEKSSNKRPPNFVATCLQPLEVMIQVIYMIFSFLLFLRIFAKIIIIVFSVHLFFLHHFMFSIWLIIFLSYTSSSCLMLALALA